jgi:hypothetical protein
VCSYEPFKRTYKILEMQQILSEAVKGCAVVSIMDAVKEAVECNEGATDLTVAVDGTCSVEGMSVCMA